MSDAVDGTPKGCVAARELRVAMLDGCVAVSIVRAHTPDSTVVEWMTMSPAGARHVAGLMIQCANRIDCENGDHPS